MARRLFLLVALASCSFDPAALSPGGGDARLADAPLADAPLADAAPPDAPVDQCAEPSTPLVLGDPVSSTVSGISRYANASCPSEGDSGETFFSIDVVGADGQDLVVDVTEPPGGNDSQIDISTDCTPAGSVIECVDVAPRGHGDVAVLPAAESRRYYVVVEAFGTFAGAFDVRAFLRPVVGLGQPCAVDLDGPRCQTGFCVTTADTKAASCQALTATAEDDAGNDVDCSTPHSATADFVLSAQVNDAFDQDWVRLQPAAAQRMRAVLYGADGGCPIDARLRLHSGSTCGTATLVESDDNSGLGPCPALVTADPLDPSDYHLLEVSLEPTAPFPGARSYTLVVDYIDE